MKLAVIGLSHNTAPVALRERFAQGTEEIGRTLGQLRALEGVDEACVISTCNRVEFYVAGSADGAILTRRLKSFLLTLSGLSTVELEPHLYVRQGEACVEHLFRVSCSLDSQVLGEPQILGQVKQAFAKAEEAQCTGPRLSRVFQKAFAVAKRVRTETGIAENAVSTSYGAVELGRQIFDDLSGKEVLLVGAGKMSTLAARHLMAHGVGKVRVASRTFATAERLAAEIGGQPSTLDDLPLLLAKVDIVICSTAAPTYVIDKKMMSKVIRERRYRPVLFVDIAVPRDVHPKVGEIDNCYVYDVDDLTAVLEANREQRRREAAAAEALVGTELEAFVRWSKAQEVVPVIKALRAKASEIARAEVTRTTGSLKTEDPKVARAVQAMGNAIVNKLLHPVMTHLKAAGAESDPQPMIDALIELFELDLEAAASPPARRDDGPPGAEVVELAQRKAGAS